MDTEMLLQMINNVFLVLLALFSLYYMVVLLVERRKRDQLLNLHRQRKKNSAQKIGDRIESIRNFYDEIDDYMTKRGKEHISDLVFYGIVLFALVVAISMALTGQYVLAVGYPVFLIWFIRRMMTLSQKSPISEMEEELPAAIDNMVRVYSKYSDIKTIVYETSQTTSGPLRNELDLLSRQMNTKSPLLVLEEFSEKHNSVWLNNFGFTLIGYLQDSTKEETLQNLRHLRSILDRENITKKDAISERTPSLMVNYALASIGVVGAFANIFMNPQAFDFFFHSYLGLFCFTAGFGSVLGTVYMNIRMMKVDE